MAEEVQNPEDVLNRVLGQAPEGVQIPVNTQVADEAPAPVDEAEAAQPEPEVVEPGDNECRNCGSKLGEDLVCGSCGYDKKLEVTT